ncbi:glycerate kinase [Amycolatopsis sp. YIM 10]|uniref:glycerate kinase n=1 Tax=Amycolatopsis sp. YIM 10 TaxID=2653857 RepID=UPI0012AAB135|nr:Glycerate kinase [Amycolatopsis sp. YIM 10]
MTGVKVVVAPDKFKGSLSAPLVAAALTAGIRAGSPDAEVVRVPVADGGDGFLGAAVEAGYREVTVTAEGPTREPIRARYATRDGVAVIELAETAGLVALPGGVRKPMTASTYGTGLVVRAALDAGCRSIVLGIGGSASTDGGRGLLEALGARVALRSLTEVLSVDLASLHPALATTEVVIAADVDNPLLGENGAAAVYGPQKGASPVQVALLDHALSSWADQLDAATGTDHRELPGAGAAGGVGYGLVAALGAHLRPGIDLVLDLAGFDQAVVGAQLVVTGEGALDEQTLRGKAALGVATRARAASVPVVAVAGKSTLSPAQLQAAGFGAAFALTDLEPDTQQCMTRPGPLLERIGRQISGEWLATVW